VKKFVLIVAGGSGNRMGSEIPKQFLEICGKPILMHTIQVFYDADPDSEILLVLPEQQQDYWNTLCQKFSFRLPHRLASGGENRFYSVKNGLSLIDQDGIVFIHDGVRPLVSRQTIERCCQMAQKNGNAIPVLSVNESLRKRKGQKSVSVNRTLYLSVQTPQTFRSDQIIKAYEQEFDATFTDDASVAEKAGFPIFMVEGNRENIKITNPEDLIIAEAFLASYRV